MNKSLFITLLVLLPIYLKSQEPYFKWGVKLAEGQNYSNGWEMDTDEDHNIYVTGWFSFTVDLDPGVGVINYSTVNTNPDLYTMKLDSLGNLIWVSAIGGLGEIIPRAVRVDENHNVYTIGRFEETVDFDPGSAVINHTAYGSLDQAFIQKLDSNGNFVWVKTLQGTGASEYTAIDFDFDGNVVLVGMANSNADIDPGIDTIAIQYGFSAGKAFIQKLDTGGNLIWAKIIGLQFLDRSVSVHVDQTGNLYTAGYFSNTVDFDPGSGNYSLTASGIQDVFVQKLDSNGHFLWAKSAGGNQRTTTDGGGLLDFEGNYYLCGTFEGTTDFDPSAGVSNLTAIGSKDVFIEKLDSNGNFLWVKAITGGAYQSCNSIAIDQNSSIYVSGGYQDTLDCDPGLNVYNLISHLGSIDAFITKLDLNGQFEWAASFEGPGTDNAWSVHVDNQDNVYSTGYFYDTLDFDPGINNHFAFSSGLTDGFLIKLGQSECIPTYSIDSIIACDTYSWIDGNTYSNSNNTATYVLVNSQGCDSIISLNLTITSVDVSTSVSASTISANNSTGMYQWLKCDSSFTPIEGDTFQSFTAMFNGSFAVQIIENGCIDTSECVSIETFGIEDFGLDMVSIYPNPNKGDFSFSLNGIFADRIEIYNSLGQPIRKFENISANKISTNLNSGAYMLVLTANNKKYYSKLIIE